MKPFALMLALIATVSVAAQTAPDTEPASAAVTVPRIAPAIRNPFAPTAAEIRDIRQQSVERAPASQLAENTPTDSEVLELPKMTVKQQPRPRPRLGDHKILGPQAFNEELAKKMTTGLDRGLNKFSLGGQSAAERAREDYNIVQKRQFLEDVMTISKAAAITDPANAKALREAAGKP